MLLKDYIPDIKKRYSKIFFSGIAFDSPKVKKIIFFLQLKEQISMVTILYLLL